MKLPGCPAFDKSVLRRTVVLSLLFLFAAHAFCFFNLTFSSSSVMLSVSSGRNAQIAGGQYLQPYYWRIRGSISSPLLVGLLCALYLTLTQLVMARLLGLRSTLSLFALCGAMTANAAVTSICAGSLNTADAAFLAFLLAALATACCLRMRLGLPVSAVLLAAALGLHPTSLSFFAALTLLALMGDLMESRSARALLFGLLRLVLVLALGAALYAAGDLLLLRRSDLEQEASLHMFGMPELWLAPIRALLAPLNAYPTLSILLRALVALLAVLALALSVQALGPLCAALLLLCALLLPIACALPVFSAQGYPQITLAFCLMDVLPVLLLSRLPRGGLRLKQLAACALGVVFLGSIVFSNQVYLKKNLEFESTLSVMSRVYQRIEETEGYRPGYTPVAIIGTPEASSLSAVRRGFEHLSALDAAGGNYAVASDEDMIWYNWMVMGYPMNLVSMFELQQLREDPQVLSMPLFPSEGCCAFIGDTLVLRLSGADR